VAAASPEAAMNERPTSSTPEVCARKIQFETQAAANRGLVSTKKRSPSFRFRVYRCDVCTGFHLTKVPK
jgi:hypothetical protein